jgi:hypothetical protein
MQQRASGPPGCSSALFPFLQSPYGHPEEFREPWLGQASLASGLRRFGHFKLVNSAMLPSLYLPDGLQQFLANISFGVTLNEFFSVRGMIQLHRNLGQDVRGYVFNGALAIKNQGDQCTAGSLGSVNDPDGALDQIEAVSLRKVTPFPRGYPCS